MCVSLYLPGFVTVLHYNIHGLNFNVLPLVLALTVSEILTC